MLNWLVRYASIGALLLDADGRLNESLLDVGSGPHGFACTGSAEPFVGLDLEFTGPVAPSMLAFRGRAGAFPFADGSFDTVISLDALEHVPPCDRRAFVGELARVAARRAVVVCPSAEAGWLDDLMRAMFVRSGLPVPEWLGEHDEYGLPTPAEIEAACADVDGFDCRPLPMTNGLLSMLAVVADFFPEFADWGAAEFAAHRERWADLFRASAFGESPRKGFLLERLEPVRARVDRSRLEETTLAAARCLDCGGGFERDAEALVCAGCGGRVTRRDAGYWDLAAPVRVAETASVRVAETASVRVSVGPPTPSNTVLQGVWLPGDLEPGAGDVAGAAGDAVVAAGDSAGAVGAADARIPCYALAFFDPDVIRRSLEFLTLSADRLEIVVVENRSENTDEHIAPFVRDLVDRGLVSRYVCFDENIGANALRAVLRSDLARLAESELVLLTDADLVVEGLGERDWLLESLEILEHNPDLLVCAVDLDRSNLPLAEFPDAAGWVPPPIRAFDDHVEGTTGCHLALYRRAELTAFLDHCDRNGLPFLDTHAHRFCYELAGMRWGRTLQARARHLTWDSYADPDHPYRRLKDSRTLAEWWEHDRTAELVVYPPRPAEATTAARARRPQGGLDTRASLRLWLEPIWDRPETWLPALSAYVAAADPDDDACLCLDVVERDLPLELVANLVAGACEAVGAGRRYADVMLVDDPVDLVEAGVRRVRSAVDVRAALGAVAPALPDDPAALVSAARRTKELADILRWECDRWRFDAAPDPVDEPNPLVTIRIATWQGEKLLTRRAIPSVLAGTYRNVEIVVVSDGPDPEARRAVEAIDDPRVRYAELPRRPVYPKERWNFWVSAGADAVNYALDLARGSYVAALDQDDAFTERHVESLLSELRRRRADFVWAQAVSERRDGPWRLLGTEPLAHGEIAHGTVLYSSRLAHFRYDRDVWLLDEPGDWNLWHRMRDAGATMQFVPEPVLVHFRELGSIEEQDGSVDEERRPRPDEVVAADLLRTPARWLLDVAWR